jgi:hypothetical protein
MLSELGTNMALLRRALQRAKWQEAKSRSWRCLGLGTGALRSLESDDINTLRLRERASASAESSVARVRAMVSSPDRRAALAAARTAFEQAKPEKAARMHSLLDALLAGDTAVLDGLVTEPTIERSAAHDVAIAARLRGLLGLFHCDLNAAIAAPPWPDPDFLYEHARSAVQNASRTLTESQSGMFDAFKGGKRAVIARHARLVVDSVESTVLSLAVVLARCHTTAASLVSSGKGTAAERMGEVARFGGELVRELGATYAAALRIASEAAIGVWSKEVDMLVAQAATLSLDASLPDGRNVEIAKLATVPDGTSVDVSGFVSKTTARRPEPQKLIGHLELVDPSSQETAEVVGLFVHPAHAGIATAAFVRATGTYRHASTLNGGKPTVELTAIPLNELANRSWRIGFLSLARQWISRWPNRLAISWSIGPHTAGDAAHQQGAGDLIYPPLVRREV